MQILKNENLTLTATRFPMQKHELKIERKIIIDRLKILTFKDELNKDASDSVALDQQRIERLKRMDDLQQPAVAKAIGIRKQNEKRSLENPLYRIMRSDSSDRIDCGEATELRRLKLKLSV